MAFFTNQGPRLAAAELVFVLAAQALEQGFKHDATQLTAAPVMRAIRDSIPVIKAWESGACNVADGRPFDRRKVVL
jgi:hypothetical protein